MALGGRNKKGVTLWRPRVLRKPILAIARSEHLLGFWHLVRFRKEDIFASFFLSLCFVPFSRSEHISLSDMGAKQVFSSNFIPVAEALRGLQGLRSGRTYALDEGQSAGTPNGKRLGFFLLKCVWD